MTRVETLVLVSLTVPLVTAPAGAEVKVVMRPDGTHYMYNTGPRAVPPLPSPGAGDLSEFDLEAAIGRYSRESRLDVNLVKAVIGAESAFNVRAVSRKGAMGLMQLMPETAGDLAVSDPFDPEQNIRAGTRYLRQMLDAFTGSLELALAAYNAGPEAVRRFGGVPPFRETVEYVEKVMRLYHGDPAYTVRGSRVVGHGRQTYLSRDPSGLLIMSTTPPPSQ